MIRFRPSIAAAGLVLLSAGLAHASVKDGVDAWSAGDFTRAVSEWKTPAAKGDADAMFNLAQAYRLGRGVPEDLKQAETLYARAAAKGHLKASDNYGLLLFQDGRRAQAMPYVTAAADRGDPRAQYLLGIAHFNGDLVAKDWVKAYALLTLAHAAGLPQAVPAIGQMDEFVPLPQRQQAQLLAARMRSEADARRSTQLAAADLGNDTPTLAAVAGTGAIVAAPVLPTGRVPQAVTPVAVSPSIAAAEAAVAEAMRATGSESPATAGADYARPNAPAAVASVTRAQPATPRTPTALPSAGASAPGGPWKLQLGAFALAGGADRAWEAVRDKSALAGKRKVTAQAGRLTRLLASGWANAAAAQAACRSLKASGHTCVVVR